MRFKPFTYFLCAITLILIILSPWLILSLYQTPPEAAVYKGIVTLWHITDWRTGGSSAASFLLKRVAEFETYNAHVIIEIHNMTAADAQKALSIGDTPDIISYPMGYELPLTLLSLPQKDTAIPLPTDTAYPYMCGGYCILVNTDMTDEHELLLDDDWGIRPDDLLSAAEFGVCFDAQDGRSALPAIALHAYPADPEPNISTWGRSPMPDAALHLESAVFSGGLEAFCDGQSCVLIASHKQLFDVRQRYMQGDAPAFCAYAIGGYTDMVQCIGGGVCEDETKQAVCVAFAEYLLSKSAQSKLSALGVLPVLSGLDIYEDDVCLRAMYTLLTEDPVIVTPKDGTMLDELAADAFGGDSRALRQLRRLLRSS